MGDGLFDEGGPHLAQPMVVGQVFAMPDGSIRGSVNPGLPPEQMVVVAARCAEVFARIAAQEAMAAAEPRSQILVPKMVLRG